MWETKVQSLGWLDPLEEGMATHSSILAWRISWTEEPDGLESRGHKESDLTKQQQYVHFIVFKLPLWKLSHFDPSVMP